MLLDSTCLFLLVMVSRGVFFSACLASVVRSFSAPSYAVCTVRPVLSCPYISPHLRVTTGSLLFAAALALGLLSRGFLQQFLPALWAAYSRTIYRYIALIRVYGLHLRFLRDLILVFMPLFRNGRSSDFGTSSFAWGPVFLRPTST